MLGFSLQKLIVLGAIIAIVWYGFQWLSRYQKVQKDKEKDRLARRKAADTPSEPRRKGEDLEACPRCGAFVPAGSTHDCV